MFIEAYGLLRQNVLYSGVGYGCYLGLVQGYYKCQRVRVLTH